MLYLCGIPGRYTGKRFVSYRRIAMQQRIGIELGLFLTFQTLALSLRILATGYNKGKLWDQ